jgi:hypothetical protein
MDSKSLELSEAARAGCADRIGMARLAKMAFDGKDLRPIWAELIAKLLDGRAEAGEGLDLSLIAQLLGDKEAGLAIQREVLLSHQLFRSPCVSKTPRLRVLALAAATDMGSNTPIEFLLEESGIELMMLYVIGEAELPVPLPDHDVAIVIAARRCARSTPRPRIGRARCSTRRSTSAISTATSCIACSAALPACGFQRRSAPCAINCR